jgi:hypothetical protein
MELRGRPPKPTEQKRRLGNPGKRALPATIHVLPPADLPAEKGKHPGSAASAEFFDALMETGAVVWLGQTDVLAIEIARQVWVDREKARLLWHALPGDKDLFNAYAELTRRLSTCLQQLGLDPIGRTRLGVAEVKRQTTLDALEARRAKRRAGRHAG